MRAVAHHCYRALVVGWRKDMVEQSPGHQVRRIEQLQHDHITNQLPSAGQGEEEQLHRPLLQPEPLEMNGNRLYVV